MISTQLKVVIWKKFVTRKKHWLLTVLELLMPVVTFLLFVFFISQIRGTQHEYISSEHSYEAPRNMVYNFWDKYLFYSPRNEFSNDIMNRTAVKIGIDPTHVIGFDSRHDLLEFYRKTDANVYTAVVFRDNDEKKFDYIIGIEGETSDNTLYLQRCLDMSFIERVSGENLNHSVVIKVKNFPYIYYYRGMEYTFALPLAVLFGFVFLYPSILKCVVEEKQSGMKELMKMAGMKSWMLWLGWSIYAIVSLMLAVIFITILLKISSAEYLFLTYTDGSIFFVYLLLFGVAAIAFCFAISSFFSRPPIAITAGVVIWITSYVIPSILLNSAFSKERKKLPWIVNILICLLPNMCLQYGCQDISDYEARRIGVRWTNFYKPGSSTPNNLSMLNILSMFIVDTALYTLFTFYMDRVNPGKYGVRRPILYPIYSLAELILKFFRKEFQLGNIPYEPFDSVEVVDGLQKGIEIRKLCKIFGDKLAVNNMNLDIYKDQITILLGHNGAGKTSTMSMITGMLTPTTGSVLFNGKDLRNNMKVLRQSLGMCPQHNLFCGDFTVHEHLIFFAMLKGRTSIEAKQEAQSVLEALKLFEKRNSMVDTLSGGMKRKLSLGMAIVGDPNVLVLDEPTAGMDPESRREIWDLLLSWRESKTILLTTHFMEEADALGDWIAIMANGTLQCYGTPMYLKRKYDTGYHLSLIISGVREEKDAIMTSILRHIEEAKIRDSTANNMVFVLPFENKMKIADLLVFLEENKDNLKIQNISLTVTTLEDVFLKAKMEIESGPTDDNSNQLLFQVFTTSEPSSTRNIYRWPNITFALIKKRAQFYMRNCFMYLLPVLLILVLFLIVTFSLQTVGAPSNLDDIDQLEPLNLEMYTDTEVYYNGTKVDFVQKLMSYYTETVKQYGGRPLEVENIDLAIQNKIEENFIYSLEYIVAGATFNEDSSGIKAVVYYNLQGNGQKISLHLVMNAIAKTYLGGAYSITTSLWRHSRVSSYRSLQPEASAVMCWYAAVPLGFLFVLANFIIFPHAERTTTFKHLQYMSGVTPWCYWIVNFLSDLFVYTIIAMFAVAYIDLTYSLGAEIFGLMLLVLFGCGFGSIPLTYLFSRKKSSAGAYGLFITLGIFLAVILSIFVTLMEVGRKSSAIANACRLISVVLIPPMGLIYTGSKLLLWSDKHPEVLQSILEDFILLLVSGTLYLLINILVDTYLIRKLMCKAIYGRLPELDRYSDVYIRGPNENILAVDNLHKVFRKKHIVKGISFALSEGQCLGILGVNGAGKTTTFRMLTREIIADKGTVELVENGRHIDADKNEYVEKLGYCPQSDALNFALSARQTLSLFASLRNLDHKFVDVFLKMFELEKFADTPCAAYSGGNKRKLNLAVALLGYPKYVLLDEPTNGVDPSSRRKFWKLIRSFQENMGVSFILTSHSMVECEALCSYMKIMKAGRFVKGGTIADLKRGIGGFSIKLKLIWKESVMVKEREVKQKVNDEVELKSLAKPCAANTLGGIEELKSYFINVYGAQIKNEHSGLLHFYIENKSKTWSALFKEIEALKTGNPHLIEDYVISEATLEDVFLSVAREI